MNFLKKISIFLYIISVSLSYNQSFKIDKNSLDGRYLNLENLNVLQSLYPINENLTECDLGWNKLIKLNGIKSLPNLLILKSAKIF